MEMARLSFDSTTAPEPVRHPQWFVLQTEPQREHAVNGYLIGRRFRTYCPTVGVWTTRGVRRTKVKVLKPMFRSYIFIELDFDADRERIHFIRAAPGFHNFLRYKDSGDLAAISEIDLRRIQVAEEKEANPAAYASRFAVGEHARVCEGSFSGFNVEISALGDEERITVLIGLLGREVRWQTSPLNLEKL